MKLLVLDTLKARPMHGYEVSKQISSLFGGRYEPSPGVIYPTLQWLADSGYAESSESDGKMTYKMTAAGEEFLSRNRAPLDEFLGSMEGGPRGDFPILRSARRLERTITVYLPEMSQERRVEVARILDDARRKIEAMMEQ